MRISEVVFGVTKLVFCNTKTNERRVSSKSSFLEKRKKTHAHARIRAHTRTHGERGRV